MKSKLGLDPPLSWCNQLPEKTFPVLTRPPLREALIDIRLSEEFPATSLGRLESLKLEGYPDFKPIKKGAFRFEISRENPASASVTSEQILGRRYDSAGGERVLQIRRDGMTLSILKNYTQWEALREGAQAAWKTFLEISGPVQVARLAVRYVNGLEVRFGDDYDEYLTAGPRIPPQLPQVVNSFFQRVEVPVEDAIAIITQRIEPPIDRKGIAILDIDVSCACALDASAGEIWEKLDVLRVIANDIFFASITEKVLKSYL